jgi:hypothetical protein
MTLENKLHRSLISSLLIIGASASGCTTMRPITPTPTAIEETVRPGDKVRVTTRDNRELEFEVQEITENRLVGEQVKVTFSDIGNIERKESNPVKTTGLVVGVLAGMILLGLAIFAIAHPSFGPMYGGGHGI